jgi:DNA-nicking Smr family endonuclease
MSRRRPRDLRPDEEELWLRVARTAAPMHPRPPRPPEAQPPAPAPAPRAPETAPFQIGSRVPHPPVTFDLRQPPGHAPVRMDAKTHTRMTRGKLAPEARIDLHGMTVAEAHPRLTRFILEAQSDGLRLVLVITGKGRGSDDFAAVPQRSGVLRQQVPHWLALPPLGAHVLQVTEAHLRHGGAGAYYVYLRRAR